MRERAVRFGTTATLVGVLSEPGKDRADQNRPAVLLLNSGILHHVGACRLHVRIARRLAEQGFTCLRFDHSGIGDSEPRKDTLPFERSAVIETQEAMNYLTQTAGARRFVLMGLCSGADMGFRVATVDTRVVGLVQLDAWAYRTAGYWMRHYGPRLLDAGAWRRLALRVARGLLAPRAAPAPMPATDGESEYVRPEYRRRVPPRREVAAGLRALVARGVEMFCVFSGGQADRYNHRAQYRRSFRDVPFGERLHVEYLPEADHIFTGLDLQAQVIRSIAAWMERSIDPPGAVPQPALAGGIEPPVGGPPSAREAIVPHIAARG